MFLNSLNLGFWKYIRDETFGLLKFSYFGSYWYGKTKFSLTGNEVYIYFWDLEDKVTEEHKLFYREVETNYWNIINDIEETLKNPSPWTGDLPDKNFREFKFVGLSFPRVTELKKDSFAWDLYFSYAPQKPSFTVGMQNWKPDKDEIYSGE